MHWWKFEETHTFRIINDHKVNVLWKVGQNIYNQRVPCPEGGSSRFVRNVGVYIIDFTVLNFVRRNFNRQPRQRNRTTCFKQKPTTRPAHKQQPGLSTRTVDINLSYCTSRRHEGEWREWHTHMSIADWWIIRETGRRRAASHTSPLIYIDTSPLRLQEQYDVTGSSVIFEDERADICCLFCPR